ncbi:MAG: ArsR/SmtB family transcription factor [Promethearchaeota archaeon]
MENKIQDFLKEINCGWEANVFLERGKTQIEEIKKSQDFKEKLQLYNALGNKTRYLIYSLLQDKPSCTCALAQLLGMSEGSITHHLKKLEKAGLIFGTKKGRFTIYFTKKNFLEMIK